MTYSQDGRHLRHVTLSAPEMPTSRTILLVEDEPHLRAAVAQVLGMSGYAVLAAGSGEEALRLAADRPEIAAIVTDIRLPDMYGRRLAHRVEEVRGRTAAPLGVVYVSGNAAEVADAGALAERERFLAKPFDFPDLLALVEAVLRPA